MMSDVMERAQQRPGPAETSALANDLAQAMLLLRASNVNMMRLQLAVERQDRKSIMAAMDDLVGIDRELGQFIGALPGAGARADATEAIDRDRHRLVSERFIMARGKSGPAIAPPPPAAARDETAALIQPAEAWQVEIDAAPARPSRWPRIAIGLVVAAVFAAILLAAFGRIAA